MADQELQRMQELLAQVNREYEQFGRILPQTQQQLNAAKTGIKNFDMQLNLAGNAIKGIAGAATDYAKAMYNGERGAKAFNKSIDGMADAVQAASAALALLVPGGPLIKGLVAGIGYLAGEAMKAGKVIGEQADMTFKAYQDLAQSGAAAGDGLNGVFQGLQKMGLGVQEAASYIKLFNENAQTMAQFGGTVSQGRKQFENTVAEMKPFRQELQALGLSQEQQNEATMTYVRIQNRLNNQTKDNANVTGAAAAAYIKEMDQLTKVTGMSRKQQEEALEKAMRHQRFAALIDEMNTTGRQKEAKQLQLAFRMAAAQGQDMADAFMDTSTGFIDSAAAQKGYMSSQGELNNVIDRITTNQVKDNDELASNMQGLFGAIKDTTNQMRDTYKLGVGEEFMLSYGTAANVTKTATNDFAENFKRAANEISEQTGTNGRKQEELLADYTRMIVAQQETMLAEQKTVQLGVDAYIKQTANAAEGAEKLAKAALKAAENLKALGLGANASKNDLEAQDDANWESATTTEKIQSSFARGIEKSGKVVAVAAGLFSDSAEKWVDDVVEKAQRERVASESNYLQGQGRFTRGVASGGASVQMNPDTASAVSGAVSSAGGGVTATGTQDLKKMGLKIKEGDVQKEGSGVSAKLLALARGIQENIPGFAYFSGFNDKFHQEKSGSSKHTSGLAADFALNFTPSPEQGAAIVAALKQMGASYVQDEYNNPSSKSTAGHIHAEVALAQGGLVTRPTVAMVGEAGTEAVLPLNNLKDMVNDIKTAMKDTSNANNEAMLAGFEAMLSEIRNLVSVNKSSNDIQEKILRMQS